MKHYPDQDVSDNRRSVRRRARQLEQRQRRALREQGQQLLERAGRVMAPRNDEGHCLALIKNILLRGLLFTLKRA